MPLTKWRCLLCRNYHVGPFLAPQGPFPKGWEDACIADMKAVGYLNEAAGGQQPWKQRPNEECPAGWFLCRGLCYTIAQRETRGPSYSGEGADNGHDPDFMGLEARCGLCGKARVAFLGGDAAMQKVVGEAARQSLNDDKVWGCFALTLASVHGFAPCGATVRAVRVSSTCPTEFCSDPGNLGTEVPFPPEAEPQGRKPASKPLPAMASLRHDAGG